MHSPKGTPGGSTVLPRPEHVGDGVETIHAAQPTLCCSCTPKHKDIPSVYPST